jgi:hypothetical protein
MALYPPDTTGQQQVTAIRARGGTNTAQQYLLIADNRCPFVDLPIAKDTKRESLVSIAVNRT